MTGVRMVIICSYRNT